MRNYSESLPIGQYDRDCCCHVRISMILVAVVMLLFALISFGIASAANYYLPLISGSLWLADGIFALCALHQGRVDLMIVTVRITLSFLAINFISAIVMAIVCIVCPTDDLTEFPWGADIHVAMLICFLLFLIVNIWFLAVSNKCRSYLDAQHRSTATHYGVDPKLVYSGPPEVIVIPSSVAPDYIVFPGRFQRSSEL